MVLTPTKRFPREHRLKKRWQYLAVQQGGYKVVSRFFIGLVMSSPGSTEKPEHARLGITTTGRYGNAVVRNWTKRVVREAFRQGLMDIPDGIDVVIIPKKHAQFEASALIFKDLNILGRRVRDYAEKVNC